MGQRIHDPSMQISYQIITWEVAIPVHSVCLKIWRDYRMVIGRDSLNYAPVTFWRPDLKIDCVWGLRTSREFNIFWFGQKFCSSWEFLFQTVCFSTSNSFGLYANVYRFFCMQKNLFRHTNYRNFYFSLQIIVPVMCSITRHYNKLTFTFLKYITSI